MECEHFEDILASYVSGDLCADEAKAVETHAEQCAACRESLEAYRSVARLMADEPMLVPTAGESAALAQALDRIPACTPRAASGQARELVGFALATAAAFAFLVVVLALQAIGRIDIMSVVCRMNPLHLALAATVAVFVTSFIPIMVTARRRPLNGMTFVR